MAKIGLSDIQDRISKLPDDILLIFMSFLDLKNAVRTSILAKRWRYLWTWLTDLDLGSATLSPNTDGVFLCSHDPQEYLNWVNQIVDAHRAPSITKFRVDFNTQWSNDIGQVEKWARFALSKGVEDLNLNILPIPEDPCRLSLGLDILKHAPYYNLKSLRLSSVDVTGETLEFMLLQCPLLELLYVFDSCTLLTLNIVSYKLKHLTLEICNNMKELEIDAVNLISFRFRDHYYYGGPSRIVFKSVPKLVEMSFAGDCCSYPFPILEQISYVTKQLTKLSLHPEISLRQPIDECFNGLVKIDVHFPNVKHLTFTVTCLNSVAMMSIKLFMDACPMLHKLKIQLMYTFEEEAQQLQEIELDAQQLQEIEPENERMEEKSKDQNPYSFAQKEPVLSHVEGDKCEHNKSCQNLKVLEVVGFRGCNTDVEGALDIIARAHSIEMLICDPRHFFYMERGWLRMADVEWAEKVRKRARKLAIVLPPNVHVGVRDKSGLFLVS